jgi:hypothetical protein
LLIYSDPSYHIVTPVEKPARDPPHSSSSPILVAFRNRRAAMPQHRDTRKAPLDMHRLAHVVFKSASHYRAVRPSP